MSVDYVGSAVSGVDPWTAELAQQAVGRTHVPVAAQKLEEAPIDSRVQRAKARNTALRSTDPKVAASEVPTEVDPSKQPLGAKGVSQSSADMMKMQMGQARAGSGRIAGGERNIITAMTELLMNFAKEFNLEVGTEADWLKKVASMMVKRLQKSGGGPKPTQVEDSGPTQVSTAMKYQMQR
ncbi:uncharacterized protein METZ01_LOCUS346093, partial [marine metagenome]